MSDGMPLADVDGRWEVPAQAPWDMVSVTQDRLEPVQLARVHSEWFRASMAALVGVTTWLFSRLWLVYVLIAVFLFGAWQFVPTS